MGIYERAQTHRQTFCKTYGIGLDNQFKLWYNNSARVTPVVIHKHLFDHSPTVCRGGVVAVLVSAQGLRLRRRPFLFASAKIHRGLSRSPTGDGRGQTSATAVAKCFRRSAISRAQCGTWSVVTQTGELVRSARGHRAV